MRNQQSVCKWQNLKFNNVLFCTLELEYQLRFVPLQVYWWCHLSLQCHSYHIKQCTMDQVHASSHTKNKKAVASYAIVPLHLLLQSGQEHKVTQFQMSCWTPAWWSVHLSSCHHGSHWACVGDTEEDWKQTHCGPRQVSQLTEASLLHELLLLLFQQTCMIWHHSGCDSV